MALKLRVNGFLAKPLASEELVERILWLLKQAELGETQVNQIRWIKSRGPSTSDQDVDPIREQRQ